jgi:hypothetical protein
MYGFLSAKTQKDPEGFLHVKKPVEGPFFGVFRQEDFYRNQKGTFTKPGHFNFTEPTYCAFYLQTQKQNNVRVFVYKNPRTFASKKVPCSGFCK